MFIFGFLVSILGVLGLLCQHRSQLIDWKDSSRNDLLCVESDIKLYTPTHSGLFVFCLFPQESVEDRRRNEIQ